MREPIGQSACPSTRGLLYGEYLSQPEKLTAHVEEFREWLVPYVRAWARHNIHFGASPGILHQRQYPVSRSFVQSAADGLEECVRFFTTACVSVNVSHPGQTSSLLRMKRQLPDGFSLVVEATSEAMMYRFPHGYPDAAKRGMVNDRFLDGDLMQEQLFPVVQLIEQHVSAVLWQIRHIYPTENFFFEAFLNRLDRCLDALPRTYRYAVEIQNPEYLLPDYFACLHEHNVAYVLHQYSINRDEPLLVDQSQIPGVLTTDFAVLQALPESNLMYDSLCSVRDLTRKDHELRLGVIETVRRCIDEQKTLYVYMSDSAEACLPLRGRWSGRHGCAPLSIAAIMNMLNPDLAKLSPLKKKPA